jgi:hypothetical protein
MKKAANKNMSRNSLDNLSDVLLVFPPFKRIPLELADVRAYISCWCTRGDVDRRARRHSGAAFVWYTSRMVLSFFVLATSTVALAEFTLYYCRALKLPQLP